MHTVNECLHVCRCPRSCCSPEYCEIARQVAKEEWGVVLEDTGHDVLPFMSGHGCVVEPHLRPMCTLHVCCINSLGFKKGDPAWTERYFKLRDAIERIEYDKQREVGP